MTDLPKSNFKYGDTPLHELSHEALLEAVNAIWQTKSDEVTKTRAERDGYKALLASPLPVHSLWARVAENAALLWFVGLMAYLLGAAK